MTLYSDFGPRRTCQIIGDAFALALIATWVLIGVTVTQFVRSFSALGRQMEETGAEFADAMTDAGATLGRVPLIGSGIRRPFDGASSAAQSLQTAGQDQRMAVDQLATGLGVAVAALPIVVILLLWLIPRIRFARHSGEVRAALRAGVGIDLLALRALTTQKISTLAQVSPNAMAAWRGADDGVMRQLAQLELTRAGVRVHEL